MRRGRSARMVAVCAVALWVSVAAPAWGAPIERAIDVHVTPIREARLVRHSASPVVSTGIEGEDALTKALLVGAVGLVAASMATALIFGRGQDW